jgi:hypothetical protein
MAAGGRTLLTQECLARASKARSSWKRFLGFVWLSYIQPSNKKWVLVRRTLFAWHCLALLPTAKLQEIEVPKRDRAGGIHRLLHGSGNNRADYLPPDHLCRHLLVYLQVTGAFQNATERSARHSHCPKALCGSRGHIHLHDFYWKRNSSKNEILKKVLDLL